ncbi:chorismate mutase [Kitasatospora mediocidica]|uniref:chorismate mutase n=1 Tax=Kitasatospora mediocidica TaxID=58352 RepID=UPI000562AFB5|nr:chorismate mutase [Kitasatospora mediocidica]
MSTFRTRTVLVALGCIAAIALGSCAAPRGARTGSAPAGPVTAGGAASGTELARLVRLAAERVLTADTVAASKWDTTQSIDDPVREKAVLDNAAAQAAKSGVDPNAVQRIFEDQITANKTVQRALFALWQAQPAKRPTVRPDLATEVRPLLDSLDGLLLTAIKQAQPMLSQPGCGAVLEQAKAATARTMGLDAIHTDGLTQALAHTCQAG